MTILLAALTVAFAALCVWLSVRVINRRARWTKWPLAAAVGVSVLYVASFGPACWIVSRAEFGTSFLPIIYRPLTAAIPAKDAVSISQFGAMQEYVNPRGFMPSYSTLFAKPGSHWMCTRRYEDYGAGNTFDFRPVSDWQWEWCNPTTEE